MKSLLYINLFILLNFQNKIFAQINTITTDIKDSLFITHDTSNIIFKTFYFAPFFDLVEKLPEGRYFVCEIAKKTKTY